MMNYQNLDIHHKEIKERIENYDKTKKKIKFDDEMKEKLNLISIDNGLKKTFNLISIDYGIKKIGFDNIIKKAKEILNDNENDNEFKMYRLVELENDKLLMDIYQLNKDESKIKFKDNYEFVKDHEFLKKVIVKSIEGK